MKRQMKARAHIKQLITNDLYVIYQKSFCSFPLIPTQNFPGFQAVKNYCSFLSEETNEKAWPEGKHSNPGPPPPHTHVHAHKREKLLSHYNRVSFRNYQIHVYMYLHYFWEGIREIYIFFSAAD